MIYGSLTVNKPLLLNNWKEKNQKLIIYNKFKILIDFTLNFLIFNIQIKHFL